MKRQALPPLAVSPGGILAANPLRPPPPLPPPHAAARAAAAVVPAEAAAVVPAEADPEPAEAADPADDLAWLSAATGKDVKAVTVESMGAAGGLSGEMRRLKIQLADGVAAAGPRCSSSPSEAWVGDRKLTVRSPWLGTTQTLVLKRTKPGGAGPSAAQGLAREALFYKELAAKMGAAVAVYGMHTCRGPCCHRTRCAPLPPVPA